MKMNLHRNTIGLAAAALAVAGLSFAGARAFATQQSQDPSGQSNPSQQDQSQQQQQQQQQGKDVVATAKAAGNFNTLTKALTEAELVQTLQGEGPYTVFAPNDAAFNKLPSGTLDELMQPENQEQLRQILLYHVASGKKMASDVQGTDEIETLQGEAISVSERDGSVILNDTVKVTKTDLNASNGVIHVIDGVLIPVGGDQGSREGSQQMEEEAPSGGMNSGGMNSGGSGM